MGVTLGIGVADGVGAAVAVGVGNGEGSGVGVSAGAMQDVSDIELQARIAATPRMRLREYHCKESYR